MNAQQALFGFGREKCCILITVSSLLTVFLSSILVKTLVVLSIDTEQFIKKEHENRRSLLKQYCLNTKEKKEKNDIFLKRFCLERLFTEKSTHFISSTTSGQKTCVFSWNLSKFGKKSFFWKKWSTGSNRSLGGGLTWFSRFCFFDKTQIYGEESVVDHRNSQK